MAKKRQKPKRRAPTRTKRKAAVSATPKPTPIAESHEDRATRNFDLIDSLVTRQDIDRQSEKTAKAVVAFDRAVKKVVALRPRNATR